MIATATILLMWVYVDENISSIVHKVGNYRYWGNYGLTSVFFIYFSSFLSFSFFSNKHIRWSIYHYSFYRLEVRSWALAELGLARGSHRHPSLFFYTFFIYWNVNVELVYHMCYISLSYVLFAKCFSVTIFGLLAWILCIFSLKPKYRRLVNITSLNSFYFLVQ